MRAMILAAGLGTRLRPLSQLRAKPAMPVLGRPVIGWLLALLRAHGVREVMINVHHLPQTIQRAVAESAPPDQSIEWSFEATPLGTGGGVRRARAFLAGSDPALVLAGDMLLDVDLGALVRRHRQSGADATLALLRDPRADSFGTIGIGEGNELRRIAGRFDLGGERDAGVFPGLRVLSPRCFDALPARDEFEDLSDWLAPAAARGALRVEGALLAPEACSWTPVGTPAEYLAVNLAAPHVSYLPPTDRVARGTKISGDADDVVLGAGAGVGAGARLSRCVVWENEQVPPDFRATGGVFASGRFYACE